MKDGKAKIGDMVRPWHLDRSIDPYEVKAIFEDKFGRVLLRDINGYGYGEHFCSKVKKKKNEKEII